MKFSVVIPTMWRSERTLPMLKDLDASDYIEEIIIVDNDTSKCPDLSDISKLIYLPQKKNIYVNPAWNLGVEASSCNYVCILNDDISFDVDSAFKSALKRLIAGYTLLGLDQLSYVDLDLSDKLSRFYGFGCCMFLDRSEWTPIPDGLRIWYGDTWMVNKFTSVGFIVINVQSEISTTVNSLGVASVIALDEINWRSIWSTSVNFLAVTYGHDLQLKCFINSIRCQTNPNWTLKIVHDGPAPELKKSLEVNGYLKDKRIQFIESETRTKCFGHHLRRIYISEMPDDGYLILTNGDNYYAPCLVDDLIKSSADIVYWDFKSHHSNYRTADSFLAENFIDMGAVAVKSSIAKKVGFNSLKFAADWEYFKDIIESGLTNDIEKINKVLLMHN